MSTSIITRRAIQQAFETLVLRQDLATITVSDICAETGISRNTFYRYFHDKYELATWSLEQLIDRILLEEQDLSHSLLDGVVSYLSQNREFVRRVLRYTGQNSLREVLLERTRTLCLEHAANMRGQLLSQEDELAIEYASSGCVSMLLQWVTGDYDLSIAEISSLIERCYPSFLPK